MLKKFVQRGRRRIETGGYPLGYVEGLNDARTKLAGFFSILLNRILKDRFRPDRLSQNPTALEFLKNPSSRRIEIRWA